MSFFTKEVKVRRYGEETTETVLRMPRIIIIGVCAFLILLLSVYIISEWLPQVQATTPDLL